MGVSVKHLVIAFGENTGWVESTILVGWFTWFSVLIDRPCTIDWNVILVKRNQDTSSPVFEFLIRFPSEQPPPLVFQCHLKVQTKENNNIQVERIMKLRGTYFPTRRSYHQSTWDSYSTRLDEENLLALLQASGSFTTSHQKKRKYFKNKHQNNRRTVARCAQTQNTKILLELFVLP